jgi:predicted transcriptional regulator YheO
LANIINPTKNANLVKQLYETGLISRKEAIKRVNPDLTDNEVDEMIKDIDSENENKSVPIAFDNF